MVLELVVVKGPASAEILTLETFVSSALEIVSVLNTAVILIVTVPTVSWTLSYL